MTDPNQQDSWIHPCDLCGALDYQRVRSVEELYACHVCGLVMRPDTDQLSSEERGLDSAIFGAIVRRLVRRFDGESDQFSILVIGPLDPRSRHLIESSGLQLTHHTGSIASGGWPPETFDVILCSRSVETLPSIASLFARARTWLRPLGLFVTGGANWESIERRLWSARWLRLHPGAPLYPGYSHLRSYATRYGFEIVTSGTSMQLGSIAETGFGSSSALFRIAALPIGLVGSLPRLGSTWWGVLVKRGLATRPILEKTLEERVKVPGLAGAGYTSFPGRSRGGDRLQPTRRSSDEPRPHQR